MEKKKESSGLMKMVLVSSVTAVVVVVLLAAVGLGAYFFLCCEPVLNSASAPAGDGIVDRIERTGRTLTRSTTDASKITSVISSSWSHAGPLYPGPKDPPGFVQSSSIEFRRDLTAVRQNTKDYDRDLPDEVSKFSAQLTMEQFEKLAAICAANDIINEADATGNRTESAASLIIEYGGEKKSIVTSNSGKDSEAVANVFVAIRELQTSLKWTPIQ